MWADTNQGGDTMLKAVISFAAGFVIARGVAESGSVKQFQEVAKEKAAQLKSAAQKATAAVREEFCGKEEDEAQDKA
jgi:hypothetical protein